MVEGDRVLGTIRSRLLRGIKSQKHCVSNHRGTFQGLEPQLKWLRTQTAQSTSLILSITFPHFPMHDYNYLSRWPDLSWLSQDRLTQMIVSILELRDVTCRPFIHSWYSMTWSWHSLTWVGNFPQACQGLITWCWCANLHQNNMNVMGSCPELDITW